jgi:hypothetical protein
LKFTNYPDPPDRFQNNVNGERSTTNVATMLLHYINSRTIYLLVDEKSIATDFSYGACPVGWVEPAKPNIRLSTDKLLR